VLGFGPDDLTRLVFLDLETAKAHMDKHTTLYVK
jgi:hypothetical protein